MSHPTHRALGRAAFTAAGCAATDAVPAGTALDFNDVGTLISDDFLFVGGPNNIRCNRITASAALTDAGGPAFPVGGTGSAFALSTLTLDNGSAATRCTGIWAGTGLTAKITALDTNGASPGTTNGVSDWKAGAPRLTFANLRLKFEFFVGAAALPACTYDAPTFTGVVSNNAAGRVTFTSQSVSKLPGGWAVCPITAAISFPVNLRRAGIPPVGGTFYVSA